jgi:heptosyltransferase-2
LHGETLRRVDEKLRALGLTDDKPIFGINPGSVWPTKRWSVDGYAAVIQLLRKKFDGQFLLFGGPDDAEIVSSVANRCGGAVINLAGVISLRELPAAISRCRVFVTNDSGPMHIAVAQRVPTVALFCATTPALGFYPYTDHAVVVEKDLSCRPCASHGGRRCPLGTEDCIREISPDAVLQAVAKLLDRAQDAGETAPVSFQPEFMTL